VVLMHGPASKQEALMHGTTTHDPCTDFTATAGRHRPSLTSRAATLVRRGWRAYWERRARRATLLILQSLDDRTLHDIGISPSEIPSCIYGSTDRRRRYDERWPWRSYR
jgi:uncharacterized protein YjiS (DUF1127 family)